MSYTPVLACLLKITGKVYIFFGHCEWFVLRSLITNSRISTFTGGFWDGFLKETSHVDRRTMNWIMKSILHGTLRLKNSPAGQQIQSGRPTDEITRDTTTPSCDPALFCLSASLAENFVIFFLTKWRSCKLTSFKLSRLKAYYKPSNLPKRSDLVVESAVIW